MQTLRTIFDTKGWFKDLTVNSDMVMNVYFIISN
jgi:hypothetical protein